MLKDLSQVFDHRMDDTKLRDLLDFLQEDDQLKDSRSNLLGLIKRSMVSAIIYGECHYQDNIFV